jgi:lipopolysaccharide biosynthesis protein/ubiquinone/menaquinone biosynthesis C-methylase UbiE
MEFTGERYIPEISGDIELEHLHRYLHALEIADRKDVLDIACGEGYGSAMLADIANKVTGIDISIDTIKHARNRYQIKNLDFLVGNCIDIPLSDASVDLIVSFETIEHLDQHDQMMKEIKRILRPSGILLISSPDKCNYSIDPGYNNPFHKRELYQHEFKQLLENYFKNITYFGQRVVYGSNILSDMSPNSVLSYYKDNQQIKNVRGVMKPRYWIAFGSDHQLPLINSSIFDQPINDSEVIQSWSLAISEMDQTIQNLTSKIVEHEQTNAMMSTLIADYVQSIQKQNSIIVERDQTIQKQNSIIVERDQTFLSLTSLMAERDQTIQSLISQIADRDQKLAEDSQVRQALNSQLAEIKASKKWKIVLFMHLIQNNFAPKNSLQFRILRKVYNLLVRPVKKIRYKFILHKEISLIRSSGLFDSDWYYFTNPDIVNGKIDPIKHYLLHGGFEGRDPGPGFSSEWYLDTYEDVRRNKINPLLHYLKFGIDEGRILDSDQIVNSNKFGNVSLIHESFNVTYSNLLNQCKNNYTHEYVSLNNETNDIEKLVKYITFYLPQYHPIAENDAWWGKGFTEWVNVTKAVPQFVGHYQPRLPGELNYYDLRVPEIMYRQVELAKKYGIFGFCFYYYWFNGKRLLEMPLDRFIEDGKIDFPFCLCWANENWTRRWDGFETDVLIAQEHTADSDQLFIKDLAKYLKHSRYIRINGRPVLLIYRVGLLPEPAKTAQYWREYCIKEGIGNPYLIAVQSFGFKDPNLIGFDAAVQFPPHNIQQEKINHLVNIINSDYEGQIFHYANAVAGYSRTNHEEKNFRVFKSIFPSWDNEARRPGKGFTFMFSRPSYYQAWLTDISLKTYWDNPEDERLVFINAWNEWAEGAYLEPDRRYGYAFLQATANALSSIVKNKDKNGKKIFGRKIEYKYDTAVILHLYYNELWSEIVHYLRSLDGKFDLFVSIPFGSNIVSSNILAIYPEAYIYNCENRGRDILPFLDVFTSIDVNAYKYICKIHTKKSFHTGKGDIWRKDLLNKLLSSHERVVWIKEKLDSSENIGLVAPSQHLLPVRKYIGKNLENWKKLIAILHMPTQAEYYFVSGSMFWFKPSALLPLLSLELNKENFEPEDGKKDGTLAHAVERIMGVIVHSTGQMIITTPENNQSTDDYYFATPTG